MSVRAWMKRTVGRTLVYGLPAWSVATTEARFYFKQDRRRDADNLLGSLKAAWDGLADAGVVANDRAFTHLPVIQAKDKANPRVEITITRKDGAK